MNRSAGILVLAVGISCLAQDGASTLQLQKLRLLQAGQAKDGRSASEQVPVGEAEDSSETQIFESLRATIAQSSSPAQIPRSYQGPGELHLLDDGTLRFDLNGGETLDETSGEVIFTSETIAFGLNTQELRVVENEGQLFLDRNGVQTRLRGLSPGAGNVTLFPKESAPTSDTASPPQTIVSLSGAMSLSFAQTNDQLTVNLTDEESGRSFSLTARVAPTEAGRADTVARFGDEIVVQVLPSITASPPPMASGCNACCGSQGQYCCSIECRGPCDAGCHGNDPYCRCTGN